MRHLALLSLLLVLPAVVGAANNFCNTGSPHPIDVRFERRIAQSGGVTVHIRNAQAEAYESWDAELNRIYRKLADSLPEAERHLLVEAQRAWLKFFEAERALLWADAMHGGNGGTLAPVVVSDISRVVLVRRVCQLKQHLEHLQ